MRIGNCGEAGEACITQTAMPNPYMTGKGSNVDVQPVGQVQPVQSPVIPQQLMPAPTTMTMPGMVTTANLTSENPKPTLTPQDLLHPLPTIVDNQPTSVAQCNSFSQWVDQNPMFAGAMLLGLAFIVFGKKGQE